MLRRLGGVQNLAHHRDNLRISLRFERKISHQAPGFVKESASRELLRISDTGGQRLEKAIQDESRTLRDLPVHNIPAQ